MQIMVQHDTREKTLTVLKIFFLFLIQMQRLDLNARGKNSIIYPANICLFKDNNRDTRKSVKYVQG